jgi:dihydroxyacetone kinase-like protein
MVSIEQIAQWLRVSARVIGENRDTLTKLDAVLGDADHGINMDRGFQKVEALLDQKTHRDIGALLKETGMTLVSSVGGASGPLYGTFFMRAGAALAGRETLEVEDIAVLFEEGSRGVMERGRAEAGDKTMVDVLLPAAAALREAADDGLGVEKAVEHASRGAGCGVEKTIPLVARKGRASYLGERSRGHQDPGATSSYLIIKALYDVLLTPSSPAERG